MGDISNEPTMEEILSSIKKIISEDGEKSLSPVRPRRAVPRDPSHDELGTPIAPEGPRREDDVLELTEMASDNIATPVQPAQDFQPASAPEPVAAIPEPVVSAPEPAPTALAPGFSPAVAGDIVSPTTVAASRSALDSLSSLIVRPEVTGSDTLEGMVREMIKPMLKEWLDARLPEVVERMVAREIARISGR
jgi:uncharacterized protein